MFDAVRSLTFFRLGFASFRLGDACLHENEAGLGFSSLLLCRCDQHRIAWRFGRLGRRARAMWIIVSHRIVSMRKLVMRYGTVRCAAETFKPQRLRFQPD